MSKTYCVLTVLTSGGHDGPDFALVEITPEMVEGLSRYSASIKTLNEVPLQVEHLFNAVHFFDYGDVSFSDEGNGVMDTFMGILDEISTPNLERVYVQDIHGSVMDAICNDDVSRRYGLLTVVIGGRDMEEIQFSGYWKGTDINFVSRTVTLDELKSHCAG